MRVWCVALAALVGSSGVVHASPGKVKKAAKAVETFEGGDRDALVKAWDAIDGAMDHKKVTGDGAAWALRGRVALLFVTNPDLVGPGTDLAAEALRSFTRAHELRTVELAEPVLALESTLVAQVVNRLEAKRIDEASQQLTLALQARDLAQRVSRRDPLREEEIHSLAVRVTAAAGDLEAARAHFATLRELDRASPGLATLVARKVAEGGDLEGALAFLAPLSAATPDDEQLLRAEVELLKEGGRQAVAVSRIDAARASLGTSVSGAFLVAELYAEAGAIDEARSAWEAVLELDPKHLSSLVSLGGSLVDEAIEASAEVQAADDAEQSPLATAEAQALRAEQAELWRRAEELLARAAAIDGQRKEVREAQVRLFEAKWQGVGPEGPGGEDQPAWQADQQVLEAARAALQGA